MVSNVTANRGYQLPDATTKLKDDVLRVIAAFSAIDADVAALLLALAGKSSTGHGHGMDAITGLVAALGNKLDVGHHDALANLTDVDVAGVANGMALLRQASKWIPVALQINNIAGLETALNGKATPADITAAINALVAASPGALDTLNELAGALGNDPNFATTITNVLGSKVNRAGDTFTGVVAAPQLTSNQAQSDIVHPANGEIIGTNAYWGLRTDTVGGFNLDIWNDGFPIKAWGVDKSGRVRAPYQPAFNAHHSTAWTAPAGVNIMPPCDVAPLNVGGHYNGATGRFTVPVDGLYLISVLATGQGASPAQAYISAEVYKNGLRHKVIGYASSPGGYYHAFGTFLLPLVAGDYLEPATEVQAVVNMNAGAFYPVFSGVLLG